MGYGYGRYGDESEDDSKVKEVVKSEVKDNKFAMVDYENREVFFFKEKENMIDFAMDFLNESMFEEGIQIFYDIQKEKEIRFEVSSMIVFES